MLLAVGPPWPAPAQAPRLTVTGAGVRRAEWVAAGSAESQLERWAFGCASAVAATAQVRQGGGGPLASMDADAIHAWLGGHRRRYPEDALSVALVRTVLATSR